MQSGDTYIERYYPGAVDHMVRNFLAIGAYAIGTLVLAVLAYEVRGVRNLH